MVHRNKDVNHKMQYKSFKKIWKDEERQKVDFNANDNVSGWLEPQIVIRYKTITLKLS
jgi:hypothetical protein